MTRQFIAIAFIICLTRHTHAQLFKPASILDSLKSEFVIEKDSVWQIRQETLAENTEEFILIGFKNEQICFAEHWYDNYRRRFVGPDLSGWVKNDTNRHDVLAKLKSYYESLSFRKLSTVGDFRRMQVQTHKRDFEFIISSTVNPDDLVIEELLRIWAHDWLTGKHYVPKQIRTKRRKK